MVAQTTSESQFKALVGSSKVTLVDWFAEWCGPCKAISPELDRLEKQFPNIQFIKVDVDKFPDLAAKYSVSAMPTFSFFKGNSVLKTIVGADVSQLKSTLELYAGASVSGGRVLGSGKVESKSQNNGNLVFYGLIGVFILYLYYNKEN